MATNNSKSVPGGINGQSMLYPQAKGFNPTFWGSGWGQKEEPSMGGSQEKAKGMLTANMKRKNSSCPNCG